MVLNKNLQVLLSTEHLVYPLMQVPFEQEINIQNMNVELVAQMFKNYRSNVLFHLEGKPTLGDMRRSVRRANVYSQRRTACKNHHRDIVHSKLVMRDMDNDRCLP